MNPEQKSALTAKLLAMADDELILAHRNSEWTGHAPILEEDIAFANIAQDELGHATLWYDIVHALSGQAPDRLVFFRDAADFRCVQMVTLPNGDWAFSMLRQYLFDAAEQQWLAALANSRYAPVADAATKMVREEMYHLHHTSAWVRRLGLGTAESRRRMQQALDELWPYALQLFVPLPQDDVLVEAGLAPNVAALQDEWEGMVRPFLTAANLTIPDVTKPITDDRAAHAPHLAPLLAEMQSVARQEPEAEW